MQRCFARKLAAHIQVVKEEFKARKEPLTLVAGGYVSNLEKGVQSYNEYRKLGAKEKCPSEHKALVVAGDTDDSLGEILRICTDKSCKVHGAREGTVHRLTPKELAARRAAVKREEAKKKREAKEIENAVKKVSLPIGPKAITALLEIMMSEIRTDGQRGLVKAKGWEVLRPKHAGWNGKVVQQVDYNLTLRKQVEKMTDEQKLRLVFEGFLSSNWERKKIIKLL